MKLFKRSEPDTTEFILPWAQYMREQARLHFLRLRGCISAETYFVLEWEAYNRYAPSEGMEWEEWRVA